MLQCPLCRFNPWWHTWTNGLFSSRTDLCLSRNALYRSCKIVIFRIFLNIVIFQIFLGQMMVGLHPFSLHDLVEDKWLFLRLHTSTFFRILQTSATAQLGQTPRALLRSLRYIAIVLGPYVGRSPSFRINFCCLVIFIPDPCDGMNPHSMIFIGAGPTSKMCSQERSLAVTLDAKHSRHSTHLNENACCREGQSPRAGSAAKKTAWLLSHTAMQECSDEKCVHENTKCHQWKCRASCCT